MVFKKSKLSLRNGCAYCRKDCNFNGIQIDSESQNAARKDGIGIIINPNNGDKYGCNSSKYK